jgi:hypothetical protein
MVAWDRIELPRYGIYLFSALELTDTANSLFVDYIITLE